MPPPLPRRRGPAAAGTDAGPKASNENRTPRLYVPYSEEFKRLVQGHSKNAACHEGNGVGAILAEVLAGFGD